MAADLVIRGGTVVDGTGAPGRAGRCRDHRRSDHARSVPASTGSGRSTPATTSSRPGFIDIHTHYDAQVFWDPALTPSCYHGVTTVVAGNCGFSIAPTRPEHRELIARTLENVEDMNVESLAAGIPWDFATFPEYLASVERRGIGLNFAAYIGHTALRLFAMGDDAYERTATPDEVGRACRRSCARRCWPAPPAWPPASRSPTAASTASRCRAASPTAPSSTRSLDVMGELRRGVVAIAPGEQCGIDDMYELQPPTGIPFTYGALLTSPAGTHRTHGRPQPRGLGPRRAGVAAGHAAARWRSRTRWPSRSRSTSTRVSPP